MLYILYEITFKQTLNKQDEHDFKIVFRTVERVVLVLTCLI